MAKAQKESAHLVSSEGTGHFYTYRKKKGKGKLKMRKYDPIARKHVLYEEKKLSRLKKRYKPSTTEEAAS